MILPALALLLAVSAFGADQYLVPSIRLYGQTGVSFPLTADGRLWTLLKQLGQGPDTAWQKRSAADWKTFDGVTGEVTFAR